MEDAFLSPIILITPISKELVLNNLIKPNRALSHNRYNRENTSLINSKALVKIKWTKPETRYSFAAHELPKRAHTEALEP